MVGHTVGENQSIAVVLNHPDFWVVEKPAGVNFHSEGAQPGFVVQCQQQLRCEMGSETRLYPVHRLDKMTSGLVILAKNRAAAQQFQQMFAQKEIEKVYLALSEHKPKKKQGWVKGDMVSARRGSWKLVRTQNNPAITYFTSQSVSQNERLPDFPALRLFYLYPKTGKTHQLRVALKSMGSPILGDERYADKSRALTMDRGYLHAFSLKFDWLGESFSIQSMPKVGQFFQFSQVQKSIQEKLNE